MRGIICDNSADQFMDMLLGKRPLFVLVIGTTETAKIPGISAAGKNPSITDYTPAADAEYILLERCMVIDGVPVTPEGIPTPALITRSALRLADIPSLIVNSGARIKPKVPVVDLGGCSGEDIRSGRAVECAYELFSMGDVLGLQLASLADYLVIGESIPGGTTTALAVLLALGIDAEGKVSSSMRENPHELKISVVNEGMRRASISKGGLRDEPLEAVKRLGDPTIPTIAGIASSASTKIPVVLAGGTQMAATLSVIKKLRPESLRRIAIATTRWIISDKSSDIKSLIKQIGDVPILVADLNFSRSKHAGLRAYEEGVVKEGVGCGGAVVASILYRRGGLLAEEITSEVERLYEGLFKQRV